ncbi:type IV pilus modification PilV family protein [Rhodoluna limnophila]|uniref:type IV pilus modification PilV family protein n=1 Tax=Rhodoluna limnophila TaxID=232537 RepID=UPI0020A2529A|nr:type II secretion system protein [Rhodoluna limnophila]
MLRKVKSKSTVSNQGFSLVEIVVAMFVLATLSLALVPALLAGIQQSTNNAVLSMATHLLSSRLDAARQAGSTCDSVVAFLASTFPDTTDSRGITLHVADELAACPTFYPGTVALTVSVSRLDRNQELVRATTLIYLQSAN